MSTQLMRLGNLNRNKVKQSQNLSAQLKQTIHKLQFSTKQNIEQQKIILNYKQQLTLIEQKIHQKSLLDDYNQQTLEQYKQQLLEKDKQINRLNYLNKEHQEDIKTYELKIKVFEQKIIKIEQQKKIFKNKSKKYKQKFFRLVLLNILIFNFKLIDIRNCQGLKAESKSFQSKITNLRSQINQSQHQKQSLIFQKQNYEDKISQLESRIKKYEFKVEQKEQQIRDLKHNYEEKLISKNDQIRKISEIIVIIQKNTESLMIFPRKNFNDQSTIQKIWFQKYKQVNMNKKQQNQVSKFRDLIIHQKITSQNKNLSLLNENYKEKYVTQFKKQIQSLTNKIIRLEDQQNIYQSKFRQTYQQITKLQNLEGQLRRTNNQYEITRNQLQIKQQQYNSICKKLQNNGTNIISPRSLLNQETQKKIKLLKEKLKIFQKNIKIDIHLKLMNQENKYQIKNKKFNNMNQQQIKTILITTIIINYKIKQNSWLKSNINYQPPKIVIIVSSQNLKMRINVVTRKKFQNKINGIIFTTEFII